MFLFFQYFYSILQSFVDVEPIPPVYVKCMMKYDIENVKGNMLPMLFVNIQDMLYITHHQLYAYIVGYMTVYLQYIQHTIVKMH